MEYWLRDDDIDQTTLRPSLPRRPYDVHVRIPGYQPTPLIGLPGIARDLGLGSLLVKHERNRFGLPSFKPLGATWAVYRWMSSRVDGGLDGKWSTFEELRTLTDALEKMTLVTATDGNHGRAVAFAASLFGLDANILVPQGTTASRIDGITSEGARVDVVEGNYDDAVRVAAAMGDDQHLVVSDTSWPGYEEIPTWIAEGYETLFEEIDVDMADMDSSDVLMVPVGVGALAEAAIRHFASKERGTKIVSVEPIGAECVLASLRADTRVTVSGPHRSMMVGLNCGTPSMVAWPVMRDGLSAAIAVDDEYMFRALRLLNHAGIQVGETGGATLAALLAMFNPVSRSLVDGLGLNDQSSVVLLATESITDEANFERIVNGGLR